jgi:small subunit ribosomal protein S16
MGGANWVIGTYDPVPKPPIDGEGPMWKDIKLDTARAKYWLGVGAQPSDPAWRLLSMVSALSCFDVRMAVDGLQAGLLEPKFRPGTKTLPGKEPKTKA